MPHGKRSQASSELNIAIGQRLAELRTTMFGERGGASFARLLGISVANWYVYERGSVMRGDLMLRLIELTGVEPLWLLRGTEPKYRDGGYVIDPDYERKMALTTLVRAALELVDRGLLEVPQELPRKKKSQGKGLDDSQEGPVED